MQAMNTMTVQLRTDSSASDFAGDFVEVLAKLEASAPLGPTPDELTRALATLVTYGTSQRRGVDAFARPAAADALSKAKDLVERHEAYLESQAFNTLRFAVGEYRLHYATIRDQFDAHYGRGAFDAGAAAAHSLHLPAVAHHLRQFIELPDVVRQHGTVAHRLARFALDRFEAWQALRAPDASPDHASEEEVPHGLRP